VNDRAAERAGGRDRTLHPGSRTVQVFVATRLPVSRQPRNRPGEDRPPPLGWLPEASSGNAGEPCPMLIAGPGFVARAQDFAEGTKLVVTAEIQQ
jgi:hypothetical protein